MVFEGCLCWPPEEDGEEALMHRTSTNVKARSLSLPVNARTAPTGEHYCVFFSERYRPFLSLFPSLRNTTDWDVCPRVWFRTLHAPQVSLASSRRGPPKRRTQKCRGALAEGVFRGNRIFRWNHERNDEIKKTSWGVKEGRETRLIHVRFDRWRILSCSRRETPRRSCILSSCIVILHMRFYQSKFISIISTINF